MTRGLGRAGEAGPDVFLEAAQTVVRLEALAAHFGKLRDLHDLAFVPGLDNKARRDAAAVALTLAATARAGDEPWVFPGVRDLCARIHRGQSFSSLLNDALGNAQATQWAMPGGSGPAHSRVVSAPSPTGGQLAQAVGFARVQRAAGKSEGVIAFLDASMVETPDFHVALNFAGVWSAPVLFVVLGEGEDVVFDAMAGYGVPAREIEDRSPEHWVEAVRQDSRSHGPALITRNTALDARAWLLGVAPAQERLAEWRREAEQDLASAYDEAVDRPRASPAQVQAGVYAG